MPTDTFIPKLNQVEKKCFLVDAKGKTLGRLATRVAMILMGKDEPFYTPHMLCGDQVIVINARDICLTGRKAEEKKYQRFSGYPGGLNEIPYEKMIQTYPDRVISEAVRRMLPKNKLASKMIKNLRVFAGSEHTHAAQQPIPIQVG